jgi:outer membrane murein-binding lipoprotein Lpp
MSSKDNPMETQGPIQINPNRAEIDDLMRLPGVGEGIAQRIVEGRPYQEAEDLLRVTGLGNQTLERILPMLTFSETTAQASEQEVEEKSKKLKREVKPTLEERLKALGWTSTGSPPTGNQVLLLSLVTGTLSVLLSVILSLAILAGINRTLNVERHAAVRELGTGFSQLESQLSDLAADVMSIDQRLKSVEGLSGRMATLESEFDLIQEDVERMRSEVDQLTASVSEISEEVGRISGKINLFDAFLEGMQSLMTDLFAPLEPAASPE